MAHQTEWALAGEAPWDRVEVRPMAVPITSITSKPLPDMVLVLQEKILAGITQPEVAVEEVQADLGEEEVEWENSEWVAMDRHLGQEEIVGVEVVQVVAVGVKM